MSPQSAIVLAAVLLAPLAGRAAYPARDPDWPCQQIKVPQLSYGTMWTGPALDPYLKNWRQDQEVAGLVHDLSQRRIPIEQAQAEIADFAKRAGPQKQQRLIALMAGLFTTMDAERASVLDGLDRFGRSQRKFASEIRADNEQLQAMRSAPNADETKVNKAVDALTMELRVFETRRTTLRYACDVPTLIEQRLFALAQAIQKAMQ